MKYKKLDISEVFNRLKSSKNGLTEEEAEKRLKKYQFNELKEKNKITPLKVLMEQFKNFIIYVLLAAAAISLLIGEITNFWVILFIIGFVILLGFIQEYKAEKSMEALKKIVQPTTKILRNGKVKRITTREVVPGDILLMETGDKVPADAMIFESIGLKIDEATLTGESIPVEKSESDLIFAGTQIVYGKCKALVVATGMQTKLGKIAGMIQETEEKTPLQIKIEHLAKNLAIVALIASVLTFSLGLLKGASIGGILIVALALAVAAVPEGLPLTLTLTLAYGMHRMAKHNAIIRKMLGVETLGSTTVICTDKTGTITMNQMTVKRMYVNDDTIDVTGEGYSTRGKFLKDSKEIKNENIQLLLNCGMLCNNGELGKEHIGDPTEISLLVSAKKYGIEDKREKYKRIDEVPFDSKRKMMSVLYNVNGKKMIFSKGAVDEILKRCNLIYRNGQKELLSIKDKEKILEINDNFASSALRVLAFAYCEVSDRVKERNLVFIGLQAMIDPPKPNVKEAIKQCKNAGIKVVMITGDHKETAVAVAKEIGLFEENKGVLTGEELDRLNDEQFYLIADNIFIYARVSPQHKVRITKVLKSRGHIVAMTGDGVNDAPALKRADIGIAMGIKGTDVTKESSVMILQDDNFATIVEAVKQGRTIYENIEKFTSYLISRNFTEVILILLGIILLGFEFLPLLAIQILFINMFDEIMPAIGLGLDPSRKGIMYKPPRNPKERILKKRNLVLIVSMATFMALSSFLVFILNDPVVNIEKARTLTFATIISMILFVPFAFRSLDESIFKIGILINKLLIVGVFSTFLLTLSVMYISFFQEIFELTTLSLAEWIVPLSVALSSLIFIEIVKVITRKIS